MPSWAIGGEMKSGLRQSVISTETSGGASGGGGGKGHVPLSLKMATKIK